MKVIGAISLLLFLTLGLQSAEFQSLAKHRGEHGFVELVDLYGGPHKFDSVKNPSAIFLHKLAGEGDSDIANSSHAISGQMKEKTVWVRDKGLLSRFQKLFTDTKLIGNGDTGPLPEDRTRAIEFVGFNGSVVVIVDPTTHVGLFNVVLIDDDKEYTYLTALSDEFCIQFATLFQHEMTIDTAIPYPQQVQPPMDVSPTCSHPMLFTAVGFICGFTAFGLVRWVVCKR